MYNTASGGGGGGGGGGSDADVDVARMSKQYDAAKKELADMSLAYDRLRTTSSKVYVTMHIAHSCSTHANHTLVFHTRTLTLTLTPLTLHATQKQKQRKSIGGKALPV